MNLNSGVFGHTISPFVIYKHGFKENSTSFDQNSRSSATSDHKTDENSDSNANSSSITTSNDSNNNNISVVIDTENCITLENVIITDNESLSDNGQKCPSSDYTSKDDNPEMSASESSSRSNNLQPDDEPTLDLKYYKEFARNFNMMAKDDVAYTKFIDEVNMNEVKALLYGTWRPEDSEKMWLEITGPERDTNIIFLDSQIITEEDLIKSKDKPEVILSSEHMYDFVMYQVHNRTFNNKLRFNTKYVVLFGGTSIKDNAFNQYYVNMSTFLHGLNKIIVSDKLYFLDAQSFRPNWELLDTKNTPEPRAFHASCVIYVTLDTPILLVCGGFTHNKLLLETHLHVLNLGSDNLTWSIFQTSGPSPPKRFGHSLAQVGNYVVLFGGCDGSNLLNDLWALNINYGTFLVPGKISSNSWMKVPFRGLTPPPRAFHSTCKTGISSNSPMIIYGGLGGQVSPRTRLYALHSIRDDSLVWSILPVYVKCPSESRTFQTMTFVNNCVVITGGDDFKNENVKNIKSLCYSLETKSFRYVEDVVNLVLLLLVIYLLSGHQSWTAFGMLYHWGGVRNEGGKISSDDSISISNPLSKPLYFQFELVYCDESNIDELYIKYIQYASMVVTSANKLSGSNKTSNSGSSNEKTKASEPKPSNDKPQNRVNLDKSVEVKTNVSDLGTNSTNVTNQGEKPLNVVQKSDKPMTQNNLETVKQDPVPNTETAKPTDTVSRPRPRRSAALKCLSTIEEDNLRHKEMEKSKE
uniref:Galactose oxidase, central domain/Kelch motif containing protein, putative n=1 Tax=Theileria annulata TaxID=5874 RepID=A0A3B0N9A2_THEAN